MKKVIVSFCVMLLVGLVGVHFYLKKELETLFLKFVDQYNLDGHQLKYTSFETGVGLFHGTLTIKDLKLEADKKWIEKVQVQGDISLGLTLWNPRTISFDTHALVQVGWKTNKEDSPLRTDVQHISGNILLSSKGKVNRLVAYVEKGSLYRLLHGADVFLAHADRSHLDFKREEGKKEFTLHSKTTQLELASDIKNPFGPMVEKIDLKARIPEFDQDLSLKDILKSWYASTGVAEIESLQVDWGALKMSSNGTFTVDERLQPILSLSADIKNMRDVLQTLVKKQVVSKKSLTLLNLVLQALGEKSPESGGQKFSLTLQEGEFSLGPVPLVQGLKVDWN